MKKKKNEKLELCVTSFHEPLFWIEHFLVDDYPNPYTSFETWTLCLLVTEIFVAQISPTLAHLAIEDNRQRHSWTRKQFSRRDAWNFIVWTRSALEHVYYGVLICDVGNRTRRGRWRDFGRGRSLCSGFGIGRGSASVMVGLALACQLMQRSSLELIRVCACGMAC